MDRHRQANPFVACDAPLVEDATPVDHQRRRRQLQQQIRQPEELGPRRQEDDRDRQGDGEILLAKFKEEDVLAGKNVSGAVTLKQTISKLDKSKVR